MFPTRIKELKEDKPKENNFARLGNTMIENFIKDGNIYTYKVLYYLAKDGIEMNPLKDYINDKNERLIDFTVSKKELAEYIGVSEITIENQILKMQRTSTSFYCPKEKDITYVSIFPQITPKSGSYKITMFRSLFDELKKGVLAIDPKKRGNFTQIKNLNRLMSLKNLHSIRVFVLLNRIRDYESPARQQFTLTINEIYKFLGVNYSKVKDFERKILEPVKEDLKGVIPFNYETNYDMKKKGRGRKPIIGYTFYYSNALETINIDSSKLINVDTGEDIVNIIEHEEDKVSEIINNINKESLKIKEFDPKKSKFQNAMANQRVNKKNN